ncbi:MAG: response regulator transcription factor, partial [Acidimicrobiales bacterium]
PPRAALAARRWVGIASTAPPACLNRLRAARAVPGDDARSRFRQAGGAVLAMPTQRRAAKAALGGLTAREQQVATSVAEGRTNAEIAEQLVLSRRTVEKHVEHVLTKLGLRSRAQIATWAVRAGLVGG